MVLLEALEEACSDKGFELPSPVAAAALEASRSLLSWCKAPSNQHNFNAFARALQIRLHKPFKLLFEYTFMPFSRIILVVKG